jgi:hypothetical protein
MANATVPATAVYRATRIARNTVCTDDITQEGRFTDVCFCCAVKRPEH